MSNDLYLIGLVGLILVICVVVAMTGNKQRRYTMGQDEGHASKTRMHREDTKRR